MRLASIHVYPLKGARGIALERADVLRTGLRHDRRLMVVDADGVFVSQRSHPRLAMIEVRFEGDALRIAERATVPLDHDAYRAAPRRRVRVWGDEVEAVEAPGDASEIVSTYLGHPCKVVFMPGDVVRGVEAPYGEPDDRVAFADGYPLLVASRESLRELNDRLAARGEAPVPMDRFRPNLVIEGVEAPFEEERHPRIRIGALTLRLPKRCARCKVTTVDQATASVGAEPLRTLSTFRRTANEVYFAMNAIPDAEGVVAVGDPGAWAS